MQIDTTLDTVSTLLDFPTQCFIFKTTVMDVKGNFAKASSDKPISPGIKVLNCRYEYKDIIKILEEKEYKYLVLQFHVLGIDTGHPHFTAVAYPKKKGNEFGKQYELKAAEGEMKIGDDTSAIMGNNILNLDKLREILKDDDDSYIKFEYLKFSPRIQYKYSGHIIYDAVAIDSSQAIRSPLPSNPCPPACPVG
jgi:hypothetical protein